MNLIKMRYIVLHRYGYRSALATNPSLSYFLNELSKLGAVSYISYGEKDQLKCNGIDHKIIPVKLNRASTLDKWTKSILWPFISAVYAFIESRKSKSIIYFDDSFPFAAYFTKLLVGSRSCVYMRLGDLQIGYQYGGEKGIKKIIYRILRNFEEHTWKTVDKVIPISNSMREHLILNHVPQEKISDVVPESIDPTNFENYYTSKRVNFNLQKSHIVVMFHGAIEKSKGINTLINAANILKKNELIKFLIVGDGSELKNAKKYSKKLNLKNIIFTGWVPFSEINSYLRSCDFGVSLRGLNEANNHVVTTALMQYYMCDKPVIAPNFRSPSEICINDKSGYLFEPGSAQSLADSVKKMIENKISWQNFANEGKALVRKNFDSKSVAFKNIKIISEA